MMQFFGFRLRFSLSKGFCIGHHSDCLQIPLPLKDRAFFLKSITTDKINNSEDLIIDGVGFPSEDEACKYGLKIKKSLMICSVKLQKGINVGIEKDKYSLEPSEIERARKDGKLFRGDELGLLIFPEDLQKEFCGVKLYCTDVTSDVSFIEEINRAYEVTRELTEKESLAIELYNLSHFETSLKARFLTLISAIECLAQPRNYDEENQMHINHLIEMTKHTPNLTEKDSMISRLRELKHESISGSCRKLLKKYLGTEAVKLFIPCYKIRSELLHVGKSSEKYNLEQYMPGLDKMVSALILSMVNT
jgi:hypothetical protein